jgi:hypothetical protein
MSGARSAAVLGQHVEKEWSFVSLPALGHRRGIANSALVAYQLIY